MKVGILGAGGIAEKMAATIKELDGVENYAVASRDLAKARDFAERWNVTKAYGSYEEMLADDAVDLVYIAVPHSHHHQWTLAALSAGRNVLCEKAFAANEAQAREMIDTAKEKKLLLAEAIWTRYMPARRIISDLIEKGNIGTPRTLSANLGYKIDGNERIVSPALAGGALLDLTVYPLNFASMVFGNDIKKISAQAVYHSTGVDGQDQVMIEYNDGRMASLFTSIYTLTDRRGQICGTEGFITVDNINNPSLIALHAPDRSSDTILEEIRVPEQISGYEYEFLACKRALENGALECEEMPHSETLTMMRQMDEIRRQFGIVFPFEQ